MLANVYLHYALDLWFQKVVKKQVRGRAELIRYADDFVAVFMNEQAARTFYALLSERLKKFELELAPAKTRVIAFPRSGPEAGKESFDFLGFEFRWGKDRNGKANLKRRTARKKLQNARKRMAAWCRENRHLRLGNWFQQLNRKLVGHYQYYGVAGNSKSLGELYYYATEQVWKWLNRRSQRKSYNRDGFKELIHHFQLAKPRIAKPGPRWSRLFSPA